MLEAGLVEEKNSILTNATYAYFASTHGVRQSSGKKQKKPPQQKHDRALKKVAELKNKARKDFRSLARNFFDLVRQHNKLKRRSVKSSETVSAKLARKRCHKDFWKFTRELLTDDQSASSVLNG